MVTECQPDRGRACMIAVNTPVMQAFLLLSYSQSFFELYR